MAGQFRLFHFMGVPLRVHISWLAFAVLLTWALNQYLFPFVVPEIRQRSYHLMAFSGTVIYFVSVVLRELIRALIARALGIPVRSITLHVFGGVIDQRDVKRTCELVLAASGFFVNLMIGAGIALLLLQLVDAQTDLVLIALGFFSVLANWFLAIINALFGGLACLWRLLRAVVWKFGSSR